MHEGLVLGEDLKNRYKTVGATTQHINNNNNNNNNNDRGGVSWWAARYTLVVLTFSGIGIAYMVRVCLSIAIVAIVTRNATEHAENTSDTCPLPADDDADEGVSGGEYEWSSQTQATLLGAFFYGYTVTNFLGGRAAEYLGAKPTFGLGVVAPCVLSLLSPLCIRASPGLFIALRVLEGMTQGLVFPSMHLMMAAWIPPRDKAKYWGFIGAGMQVGTMLAMSLGGWLCNTTFLGGWPSVFYVFGGLGVVWAVPWFLLACDLPEHHPRIAAKELQYILDHRHYVKTDKAVAIPWVAIATSVPFWAIVAGSFCSNFSFFMLLTELPTYFNNILHLDIAQNGLSSALPYLVQSVTSVLWGLFVDVLQRKNILSVLAVRKLSTAIALYCPAACLLAMMWVRCDPVWAMVVMCLAVGLVGPMCGGCPLSEQDIAPNLAGTLKGLTNTLGSATGFIAPAITGAITEGNQTLTAWNTVFIITAVLNLFPGTLYMIFATDKVQPWNNPRTKAVSMGVSPRVSLDTRGEEKEEATSHHVQK